MYSDKLFNNQLGGEFTTTFKGWRTQIKKVFFNFVANRKSELTEAHYQYLKTSLHLYTGYNDEILYLWYLLALNTNHQDGIQYIISFLGTNGRLKFIQPIYDQFHKINKTLAEETFNKYKSMYHPIAINLIEADWKKQEENLTKLKFLK